MTGRTVLLDQRWTTMLRLTVLGAPELTLGDEDRPLPLGKPFAVLAYLAIENREVSRGELAETFWSDVAAKNARASARQAIWVLRQTLGDGVFTSLDPVELAPDAIKTDVHALEEAMAEGRVEEALALRRGEFMGGFALAGARGWSRWVDEKAIDLDDRLVRAAQELADSIIGTDEVRAVEACEAALAINPTRAELHRLRVTALIRLGKYSKARTALLQAEASLTDVPGASELLQSLGTLLSDTVRAASASAPEHEPYGFHIELVGRINHFSTALEAFRVAEGRSATALRLIGPAGIGKTRLGTEVLRAAAGQGASIASIRCHRGERTLRLGGANDLAQALSALPGAAGIQASTAAILSSINPIGAAPSHSPTPYEPSAYADAILDLVQAVAYEQPLVVLIDDCQWLDAESRTLIARVFRKAGRSRFMLLLTSEARGRPSPFSSNEHVAELQPLTDAEVEELLTLAVSVDPPERTREVAGRLARLSGGSPLFIDEVLKRLADDEIVSRVDDGWVLDASLLAPEYHRPEQVQDLVRDRLARLPAAGRAVCVALADQGGAREPSALRTLVDLEEAEFLSAIADLVVKNVLEWTDAGRLDFTHERLRKSFETGRLADDRQPHWARRWPARLGLAAALGIAAAGLTDLWPRASEFPYGRGVIVAVAGDSLVGFRAPRNRGDPWIAEALEGAPAPTGPRISLRSVRRTTDGSLVWIGDLATDSNGPDAVEFGPAGTTATTLYSTQGDDMAWDVSPDGRRAMIFSEADDNAEYRVDVVVADRESGQPLTTIELGGGTLAGPFSWDGNTIPVQQRLRAQVLRFVTPEGTHTGEIRVDSAGTGYLRSRPSWCTDDDHLVTLLHGYEVPRPILLSRSSGRTTELATSLDYLHQVTCLDRGRAVAMAGVLDNRRVLAIVDVATNSVDVLAQDPGMVLGWVPDVTPATVATVNIDEADRLRLVRGARHPLTAATTLTDGSSHPTDVVWTSRDAEVASVDGAGTVTGNHVGATWIIATYQHWVRDSTMVTVFADEDDTILLEDSFETLDSTKWIFGDSPAPRAHVANGARSLSHNGSGLYNNPVLSRDFFDLSAGATLTFDFQLDVTRSDKQRMVACLDSGQAWLGVQAEQRAGGSSVCVVYPADELAFYQPRMLRISNARLRAEERYSLPDSVDPGEAFVRTTLQLRPDGALELRMDGHLVAVSRWRIHLQPLKEFRVVFGGAAVDTELLFRNVVLWRGTQH